MDKSWEIIERTLQASIAEQRSARRWKNFFRAATLGVVVTLFFVGNANTENKESGPFTAMIKVKGPIVEDEAASAHSLKKALALAFDNENAKAVVLEINSPGGSPVQAGQVYDEIKRQRELNPDVKVYAVITDVGASGAYYIASAADEIYADKASLVGSIGVTASNFGFVDLMKKLGVERRAYTAGEHKGFFDQFQPENPEQTRFWNEVLKTTHAQFIAAVKAGRGERLKADQNPELFSGLVWSGEQALALGLVDKLGDVDYVAREVAGAARVVDFTLKESFADRFANKIGATAAEQLSVRLGLSGPTLR